MNDANRIGRADGSPSVHCDDGGAPDIVAVCAMLSMMPPSISHIPVTGSLREREYAASVPTTSESR